LATRRPSLPRPYRHASEQNTQAVSSLIPAWKEGDPSAVAELTPLLTRELRRQLRRFINVPSDVRGVINASAAIEETLLHLASESGAAWPHRAHLMAAAAPVLRRILLREARPRIAFVSISMALLDTRCGTWDLLRVDTALRLLSGQDSQQGRIVELRLFGGLSTAEVADVLSISPTLARREWNFARAWIYRELIRHDAPVASRRLR
jgi:RNA polymerase sigma factor (TIGR02999 family)